MRAFATGLLALVILSACPRPPTHPVPPTGATCETEVGALTNPKRAAAMVAVHAYAYFPHGDFPADLCSPATPGACPLSLPDAVNILNCDVIEGHNGSVSRKQRAMAKLAGYALGVPVIQNAIVALGGNLTMVRACLKKKIRLGTFAQQAEFRERIVLECLTTAGVGTAGAPPPAICAYPLKDSWGSSYNAGGAFVSLSAEVTIKRPFTDVARALDGQAWDQCSKFFAPGTTYRADISNKANCKTSPLKDCATQKLPAYTLGGQTRFTLFEHFTCIQNCAAEFTNGLWIKPSYDDPNNNAACSGPFGTPPCTRYRSEYGLEQNCWGQVSGGTACLTLDEGELKARKDPQQPDWTVVDFVKKVSFGDAILNGSMAGFITQEELAEEIREVACCTPTQPQ